MKQDNFGRLNFIISGITLFFFIFNIDFNELYRFYSPSILSDTNVFLSKLLYLLIFFCGILFYLSYHKKFQKIINFFSKNKILFLFNSQILFLILYFRYLIIGSIPENTELGIGYFFVVILPLFLYFFLSVLNILIFIFLKKKQEKLIFILLGINFGIMLLIYFFPSVFYSILFFLKTI